MRVQKEVVGTGKVVFTVREDVDGAEIELIDSRDLHEALGVGGAHAHWIAARVQRLGLVADRDYFEEERGGPVRSWKATFLTARAALRIAVVHQAFNGVNTPSKMELKRQREALQEALLDARTELRQALRYEGMAGLTIDEKAGLMGCSPIEWINVVSDLRRLGLISSVSE